MRVVNTEIVLGLAVWVMGFAFMVAGWLVEALFEKRGEIIAKILYKVGALIVAVPVIIILWKISGLLYTNRFYISTYINNAVQFVKDALKVI